MVMSRIPVFAVAAAFLPVLLVAQTKPAPRLEYEVASVRPAPQLDAAVKVGLHTDGSQLRFDYLSLRDCIRIAWQVKDFQVVGPDWVASDRYNINAKLPDGTFNDDQRREMLQNLLLDRFKLAFHRDKKEFAVYALLPGKNGLKLKETAPDAKDAAPAKSVSVSAQGSAAGVFVDMGGGSYYSFADNKLTAHKLNTARMAEVLAQYMDKPVVDMTGQPEDKNYDVTLELAPDDYRVMLIRVAIKNGVSLPPQAIALADGTTESLTSAMDLAGMRLESRKAPLDVLVIDKADKTPTDN